MRIGLVYDLRSEYLAEGYSEEQVAEFDSESTIRALDAALQRMGHTVERIGHGRALTRRLASGERWDLVFTIAEGLYGRSREAQVPCLLEMFHLPYTFSDPLVCALTLDKAMAKRLALAAGVPTPAFAVVETESDLSAVNLNYPLFAKPVAEGTGKGVDGHSRIGSSEQLRSVSLALLRRFAQPVLVEEFLPGREFTTALLGTGAAARVLGTMEIGVKPDAPDADYSFDVKERCEEFVDYRPMERGCLRESVEALSLRAYLALECRDAGRVDVRLNRQGQPMFLELNPLPGLHPTHSDLPMIASQEGMSYADLIRVILDSAARRMERGRTGSTGGALSHEP